MGGNDVKANERHRKWSPWFNLEADPQKQMLPGWQEDFLELTGAMGSFSVFLQRYIGIPSPLSYDISFETAQWGTGTTTHLDKAKQILYLNLLKQSLMLIDVVACIFDSQARYTQSISMTN